MSQVEEPSISVRVDPTNPGQFFACCGLLELADRLWQGAEGWFDEPGTNFFLRSVSAGAVTSPTTLFTNISRCSLKNGMTELQLQRRQDLPSIRKRVSEPLEIEKLDEEKKILDTLWREAPISLLEPFNMRLDWFLDKRAGGSIFKTWAGQQSVAEISFELQAALRDDVWNGTTADEWLTKSTNVDGLPFNFDSNLATVGSDLDLGFSLDPLRASKASIIPVPIRPLLEFLAFVGLQRFRPLEIGENLPRRDRRYRFASWSDPSPPQIASAWACCVTGSPDSWVSEFKLLYRTEYLKSFLPATRIRR